MYFEFLYAAEAWIAYGLISNILFMNCSVQSLLGLLILRQYANFFGFLVPTSESKLHQKTTEEVHMLI